MFIGEVIFKIRKLKVVKFRFFLRTNLRKNLRPQRLGLTKNVFSGWEFSRFKGALMSFFKVFALRAFLSLKSLVRLFAKSLIRLRNKRFVVL